MVYGTESNIKIYSRHAIGKQGNHSKYRCKFDCRLIFGSICRKNNLLIDGLYSDYDQFQLVLQIIDLTTIQTPLGLVRLYILS